MNIRLIIWYLLSQFLHYYSCYNGEKAEVMIKHYCFKMHVYYSEQCMAANVNHLLHLPHVVAKLGPLLAYSYFPFESMNGKLL